jgi:hypothetical protein
MAFTLRRPALRIVRRAPIRRTSTIDSVRPSGLDGELVMSGRARDLVTAADGTATVVSEASIEARIDWVDNYRLIELVTDPFHPGTAELIGRSVSTGFRVVVMDVVAGEREQSTLLYLTCTHLSDTLRSLEDVPALSRVLENPSDDRSSVAELAEALDPATSGALLGTMRRVGRSLRRPDGVVEAL